MYDPIDVNEEIYIAADEALDVTARSEDTHAACRAAAKAYHAKRSRVGDLPTGRTRCRDGEFSVPSSIRPDSEFAMAWREELRRRAGKKRARRCTWRRAKRDAKILLGAAAMGAASALLLAACMGLL